MLDFSIQKNLLTRKVQLHIMLYLKINVCNIRYVKNMNYVLSRCIFNCVNCHFCEVKIFIINSFVEAICRFFIIHRFSRAVTLLQSIFQFRIFIPIHGFFETQDRCEYYQGINAFQN